MPNIYSFIFKEFNYRVESWHHLFQKIAILDLYIRDFKCNNIDYIDLIYRDPDGELDIQTNLGFDKVTSEPIKWLLNSKLNKKSLIDIKWLYIFPRLKCIGNVIQFITLINNRSLEAFTHLLLEIISLDQRNMNVSLKYMDETREIPLKSLGDILGLRLESFQFSYVSPTIDFFMIKKFDNIENSQFLIYTYSSRDFSIVNFDFLFPTFNDIPYSVLNDILKDFEENKIISLVGSCNGNYCDVKILSKR